VADAASAREQAREILGQRRYRDTEVPAPFKGPLRWLGDRIEDVGSWLAGAFDDVAEVLPGGAVALWLLLAAGAIALTVFAARGLIRRRATGVHASRERPAPEADPRELERDADAAERAGDWERAVRLRFRAGVLRLERGQVLEPGGLRTTGEIAAELHSLPFDLVGADFDEIVYGGRPAAPADAEAARERWKEIV
jgi:hypothetical protein